MIPIMTKTVGSKVFNSVKLYFLASCVFLSFVFLSNTKIQNQTSPDIKEKVLYHWAGFANALLQIDSVNLYSLSADSIYSPVFCETESILDADESCFTFSKQSFFSKYFKHFPSDSFSSVFKDMDKTKILIHPSGNKAEILITTQEPSKINPGHQIVFHFQIEKDKIVLVAFDTIP
jgi:hypothetical protein